MAGYLVALQDALLADCGDLLSGQDYDHALVLHVGCGHGVTTRHLSERLASARGVFGIEEERSAVDYAFSVHADERADFGHANVEDLSTFDIKWASKFQLLFSTHALLWARDQTTALRNLLWCIQPGGRCFVAVPASKPPDLNAAARVFTASAWKSYFKPVPEIVVDMMHPNYNRLWFHHPHADRVYSALLDQVGYHVLGTKLFPFKYVFPKDDDYKACLKELVRKPLELVPEAKRAAFLKALYKAAAKKARKSGGKFCWQMNYAVVMAKRPEL